MRREVDPVRGIERVARGWSSRTPSGRVLQAGAACTGALLLTSMMLPWEGWEGLRTAAAPVAAVGLVFLALAIGGRVPRVWRLAVIAGMLASALYGWRLASPPANATLAAWRSTGALAIGLAGSITMLLTGVLAGIRDRERSRPATQSLGTEQRVALTVVWRAVWSSRLLVWTAGLLGVLELGLNPAIPPRPPLSIPFGWLGNLLSAPATAWDAGSYLTIAQTGYASGGLYGRAFFPIYPALMRPAAWSSQATLVAGIAISISAFAIALYLLHRLVMIECGRDVADLTVQLVAFSPMAMFFSAVYTESIFLMLSVASFYAGRRGWWGWAGTAGALAAGDRVTGVVLLLPLLILYLYGPREDRPVPTTRAPELSGHRRFLPRYSLTWDASYLLLIPAGAIATFAYMGVHGDPLAPLHAVRTYWHRGFAPGLGAIRGLFAVIRSLRQIAAGPGQGSDLTLAASNLTDFAFLTVGCIAAAGALRRLPAAYGVYAIATIALTASTYSPDEPLVSLPRYLLVLFPCQIWLALWAANRSRRLPTLLISAGLLAFFASQFSTWRWVA